MFQEARHYHEKDEATSSCYSSQPHFFRERRLTYLKESKPWGSQRDWPLWLDSPQDMEHWLQIRALASRLPPGIPCSPTGEPGLRFSASSTPGMSPLWKIGLECFSHPRTTWRLHRRQFRDGQTSRQLSCRHKSDKGKINSNMWLDTWCRGYVEHFEQRGHIVMLREEC